MWWIEWCELPVSQNNASHMLTWTTVHQNITGPVSHCQHASIENEWLSTVDRIKLVVLRAWTGHVKLVKCIKLHDMYNVTCKCVCLHKTANIFPYLQRRNGGRHEFTNANCVLGVIRRYITVREESSDSFAYSLLCKYLSALLSQDSTLHTSSLPTKKNWYL